MQKVLSKYELEDLGLKTVEFKAERLSQTDFYEYLIRKTKAINVKLDQFPELRKYIVYVSTYDAIDKSKIMPEIASLEDKIKDSIYENDIQKELNLLSKNLALIKNLFNVTLTREDYNYYLSNRDSFNTQKYVSFINKEALLYKITAKLDENISELDMFREHMAQFSEY